MRRILTYLALLTGSAIFRLALPLDGRHLHQNRARDVRRKNPPLGILPHAPPHLPFIDTNYYRDVTGPRIDDAVQDIDAALTSTTYPWPTDVDHPTLLHTCALGIYRNSATPSPQPSGTSPPPSSAPNLLNSPPPTSSPIP